MILLILFDDTYLTIEKPAEGLFRDRGSKFQAFAYPIVSESGIKPFLAALRNVYPKANHHCWAMRLGTDRSVFRINDDDEPSGTAGRPNTEYLIIPQRYQYISSSCSLLWRHFIRSTRIDECLSDCCRNAAIVIEKQ